MGKERKCPNCGSTNIKINKVDFRKGILTCLECNFFTEIELGVFE